MLDLHQSLGDRVAQWKKRAARHSRTYRCRCGNHVFFRNTQCLNCRADLGYLPDEARVASLQAGPRPGTWLAEGREERLKCCANAARASTSYLTMRMREHWSRLWCHTSVRASAYCIRRARVRCQRSPKASRNWVRW